jgi:hypothetical protein
VSAPPVSYTPAVSTTSEETPHQILDPAQHTYCMSRTFNAGPC